MSADYKPILWNPEKRKYDRAFLLGLGLFFIAFAAISLFVHPQITAETLLIRMTASAAFVLLHLILIIGPLYRLDQRFLPLLYNRRHLGVTMFFLALIHAVFSLIQFHALGDAPILASLFLANTNYGILPAFPFQILGFFALIILFLMAASSHDFWLKNLGPSVWKALHMGVYLVYLLLFAHVLLGVIQLEHAPAVLFLLGFGAVSVTSFHLLAAFRRKPLKKAAAAALIPVCHVDEIPENRARIIQVGKEEIAIFKYEGKLSAVRNQCKHQHGPLGEGKIVAGCITCPWHGYQYLPESGCSPPPFTEKVATYALQVNSQGMVLVNPNPFPEGTPLPPALIPPK
ncbi:MAG: ferric reductase-like transmembrane domain-containing protein [Saprospiraceae bacterium]|nr:ferric reductase-like transmembrane domain-containing protein [Saprospiraceae bacterium]